jgi:hypothetical protein
MRATKSIAAAIAAAIILMMTPRLSMAQANPPANPTAPTTSNAGPPANGAVARPKHHKKKQSFMKRMKGKVENTLHKATAPKRPSTPKRSGPAKSAGPSPSQIE